MPPRPPVKRIDLTTGPSLLIDEDLINEALAAVERRSSGRTAGPGEPGDQEIPIDLPEDGPAAAGADGEVMIESLSDDLVVALDPAGSEPPIPATGVPPIVGARVPLFSIPDDLLEDNPGDGLDPALAEEDDTGDERTDPSGLRPGGAARPDPARPGPARPLTADPVTLDRVTRLRKKSRALQARLTQAIAELDQERQAVQAARARARFADLARQDAEEQRDGLDRFARGLRTRVLALEEEVARLQRRSSTETAQARQAAAESTVRELLPVLDNLQLALSHVETDLDRFVPGVEMVASQFVRSLERLGVERVEASRGTRFDPAVHEAILTMPADGVPEGHVVEAVRSGYTLGTRLLRAAQVSVAGAPIRPVERALPPAADDTRPSGRPGGEE